MYAISVHLINPEVKLNGRVFLIWINNLCLLSWVRFAFMPKCVRHNISKIEETDLRYDILYG